MGDRRLFSFMCNGLKLDGRENPSHSQVLFLGSLARTERCSRDGSRVKSGLTGPGFAPYMIDHVIHHADA